MNSGYLLTELRITGESVPNATLLFEEGLNVITGPSDTGKTYIYECIDYMLGGSTPPKQIKQARSYNKIYLEVKVANGDYHSLESDLKGGAVKLYDGRIDEITFDNVYTILNRKHNPNSDKTISAFFQKLNNIYLTEVRTNAKGAKRQLSYRDIARYILVSEERIITKKSLIDNSYTSRTTDKNTLKFIVSGEDDSDIIALVSKESVSHKKGRLEFVIETIEELSKKTSGVTSASINIELSSIEENISKLRSTYSNLTEEINQIQYNRSLINIKIRKEEKNKKELEELYFRSSFLRDQYDSDIKRLEATIEAGILMSNADHEPSKCPVCKRGMPEVCDEEEVNNIIISCSAEIAKIELLKNELERSVKSISDEITVVSDNLDNLYEDLKEFDFQSSNDLGEKLNEVLRLIETSNSRKNELSKLEAHISDMKKLVLQQESLEAMIRESKTKGDFKSISTASLTDLSLVIESILRDCKYPDLTAVSFSEESSDFVISGEDRSLFGKGYRAIIYAAFVIAIQKLIYRRSYSIGVPVIDSPLVTYKKSDYSNDDLIPVDLAMNFYRFLAKDEEVNQCVIIENVEPPDDLLSIIKHTKFTGSNDLGRYGFFPT